MRQMGMGEEVLDTSEVLDVLLGLLENDQANAHSLIHMWDLG